MANYGSRYQKKETPYGVFFFVLVVFLVFGYFLSGLFIIPDASLENFKENLLYVFMHPLGNWNDKTPIMFAAAFILWLLLISYYMYYYRNFQMEMEHGDALWLDVGKACRELADTEEKYNRVLSDNLRVSLRGSLSNNNMLVMGSSGSYKTTSLMHQNLLQFTGSYVVLDVKGDTQRKLGRAMQEQGYAIHSLNLKNPEISDRYNPFTYIEWEDDLLRVIKALHDSCRPKQEMSCADPFWDDAVDLYLQALFYYVWLDAREEGRVGTMNEVMRLCNLEGQTELDADSEEEISKLQLLMNEKEEKYGPDYPPVRDYRKLKEGAPDTVRSVILMINSMLSICETAEVKRVFSANDINIRELGAGIGGNPDKPTALFLVIPDNNNVYNWIVSMFYTQMFDILIRLSDDELHQPLPISVEVWMDEFYAGAKPADSDVLLGVVRSRNISMIPILQSVSQIKTLFKDSKWETIMDNVATVVYLGSGPAAESTHEFISKILGETTADSRTDNIHLGSQGHSGLNFARIGIKLMTPEQVKRMPPTECIVFLESHPPIYDNKAIPFDVPRRGFAATGFLKERYSRALACGEYDHPVYTVYDPVHFRYITVEKEKKLQILTDPEEIRIYEETAAVDPHICRFDIDEKDLLYISWGQNKRSKEEIGQLFRQALEAENRKLEEIRGLSVLQDIDHMDVPDFGTEGSADKSKWDGNSSLKELLAAHWDELSRPEQEEICFGMDEGLTEQQLCQLIIIPLEEMAARRRAYTVSNKNKQ